MTILIEKILLLLILVLNMFADNKMLYESFKKNGLEYECVISPREELTDDHQPAQFYVTLKMPQQNCYSRFSLCSSRDGHWQPDEKKLVDPWLADAIGRIIVENY